MSRIDVFKKECTLTTQPGRPTPSKRFRLPIREYIALLKPYRVKWWLATAALLLAGGINLALPQAFRIGIDEALQNEDSRTLMLVAVGTIGLSAALAAAIYVRHYWMSWLGNRVVADLRKRTFEHLLQHPPGFFHDRRTGEIISRLTSDIEMIQHAVGSELSIALRSLLITIGGVVLLFWTSPMLTAIMLAVLPPLSVGGVYAGRQIRGRAKEVQDILALANAGLKEAISGIETVQTFTAEQRESSKYGSLVDRAFVSLQKIANSRSVLLSLAQFGTYCAVVVILWLGGSLVIAGGMSPGELSGFVLYTLMVTASIASLAEVWANLNRASGAIERIFEILAEKPMIVDHPDAIDTRITEGVLRFCNVSFRYPARPEMLVLEDITFEARPGSVVALVGRSGAGKSTIAALIHRFWDPDTGSIEMDGVDIRHRTVRRVREALGTVHQEPVIFSGTIRENIAYGKPDAPESEIIAAAKDAHIDDFINELPLKYDTQVGERGVKVSGGQRQRIAIARALLADPRFLVLDEATSHLDSQNESLVHAALQRLMIGRTTLVIAHRLNTIRQADVVLVMNEGKIVESGTYSDLITAGSVFPTLVGYLQTPDIQNDTEPRVGAPTSAQHRVAPPKPHKST